jgi:hypothetical protein
MNQHFPGSTGRRQGVQHFFIGVLSVIGLPVLLPSCHHDPSVQQSYCKQNPGMCETVMEAKDYFAFKQGSWWVYEEETSHERDSVYVDQAGNDPNDPGFDCSVISTRSGYTYDYYPQYTPAKGCSYTGISSKRCVYIRRSKYKPGDYIGDEICFFIQNREGDSVGVSNYPIPNNRLHVKDILMTYSLGNLQFAKTIQVFEDHTLIEHNSPTNHYFSKGVGLIRKELIDSNQVWNLVSYHIEP